MLKVVVVYGVEVDSTVETMEVVTCGVVVMSTYEMSSAETTDAARATVAMID